jgi:hypothetical protein
MTTWRSDPNLAGKFHTQYPDDIEVLVHDGEPRRTKKQPEICWVRITATPGTLRFPVSPAGDKAPTPGSPVNWTERPIYSGTLLNQPHHLTSVREGSTVSFIFTPGLPALLMITDEYQRERVLWTFVACNGCGADQGLDPPTVMAKTRFPDAPGGFLPIAFTAICPCNGTMMLSMVVEPKPAGASPTAAPSSGMKPWWKFW